MLYNFSSAGGWQVMLELLGSAAFREFFHWGWKRVSNRFWHKCYVCRKSYAYYCRNSTQANDGLYRTRYRICKKCCICPDGHTNRPPTQRKVPKPQSALELCRNEPVKYERALWEQTGRAVKRAGLIQKAKKKIHLIRAPIAGEQEEDVKIKDETMEEAQVQLELN
ncbi:hypothetical protein Ddc_02523 [Ditylenchus destructor]|nr:hypothetical protein Ddc_02523 [Ditylenchus destructor]